MKARLVPAKQTHWQEWTSRITLHRFDQLLLRLGFDPHDVLSAAGTKWNFLPFTPGLVGGHRIGVDPYYLTHQAQEVGHQAEVILAGHRVNDAMCSYIADHVVLLLAQRGSAIADTRVPILGLAFKENCPDIRNTRVVDIRERLLGFGVQVDVADPWVDEKLAMRDLVGLARAVYDVKGVWPKDLVDGRL